MLFNLSDTTTRWVLASGDPDFIDDFDKFAFAIGVGAVFFVLFGCATAVGAIAINLGRSWSARYWLGLVVAALAIHIPWLVYHRINAGNLDQAAASTQRFLVSSAFVVICTAYVLVWMSARRQSLRAQPSG